MSDSYNILALVTDDSKSAVHLTLSTPSGISLALFKQNLRDDYEKWDGGSPSGDKSALTLQEIAEYLRKSSRTASAAPPSSLDEIFVTTDARGYTRFNQSIADAIRSAGDPSKLTDAHKTARRAHISEAFSHAFGQPFGGSIEEQYESRLSAAEESVFDFEITRPRCGDMIGVDLMSGTISAADKKPIEDAAEDQYDAAAHQHISDAEMIVWVRDLMQEPLTRQFPQSSVGSGSVTSTQKCDGLISRKFSRMSIR